MLRKWDAYTTYLFLRALATFAFTTTFTVSMVYQVQAVGLNPLQMVLVGTTLEIAAFLFEIPTGVVADVYSRRMSIIIGYALMGVGFIFYGIPTFAMVLFAQVLWGIGYTFTSGATDAWIVDEIGIEQANRAFGRAEQLSQFAAIVGIICSILIAMVKINYPLFVGGALMMSLSVMLMLIMPENGFQRKPAEERESWSDLFMTFRSGAKHLRASHILMLIVLSSFIGGAFSEGWDRLHDMHLINNIGIPGFAGYDPIIWFGVMGIIGSIFSIAANEGLRRMNLTTHKQLTTAVMILYGLFGLGVIAFAQSANFMIAVGILWFIGIVRSMIGPVYAPLINMHIDSSVRATVLSVDSQANALGQIGAGPIVGYIGLVSGLRLAISITGFVMFPAVFLLGFVRNEKVKVPAPEVVTV
jgi:MFS transporter, DHA3 family, tetracycline resistance protein